MREELEKIKITSKEYIDLLISKIKSEEQFAFAFDFEDDELFDYFLDSLEIDKTMYKEKWWYYDSSKKLHVADSENSYTWVSTMGLVASHKITKNKYVNSFYYQKRICDLLLNEAIKLCNKEDIYDIDSYNYSQIQELTPSIFHNIVFYYELMAKTYMSLCGTEPSHTHKLKDLYPLFIKTMNDHNHNNSFFHVYVIPAFEHVVTHLASIPGGINETFIKYDDNENDSTLIVFDERIFNEIINLNNIIDEIITNLYYDGGDSIYLQSGLYESLQEKCKSDAERQAIKLVYSFLLDEKLI